MRPPPISIVCRPDITAAKWRCCLREPKGGGASAVKGQGSSCVNLRGEECFPLFSMI